MFRSNSTWFNLINQHPDIDKVYLSPEDPYEASYQFLIKKREVIEYWNIMDDIYKNIEEYNPNSKQNIVFDDMIADMLNNERALSNSNWIIY